MILGLKYLLGEGHKQQQFNQKSAAPPNKLHRSRTNLQFHRERIASRYETRTMCYPSAIHKPSINNQNQTTMHKQKQQNNLSHQVGCHLVVWSQLLNACLVQWHQVIVLPLRQLNWWHLFHWTKNTSNTTDSVSLPRLRDLNIRGEMSLSKLI